MISSDEVLIYGNQIAKKTRYNQHLGHYPENVSEITDKKLKGVTCG